MGAAEPISSSSALWNPWVKGSAEIQKTWVINSWCLPLHTSHALLLILADNLQGVKSVPQCKYKMTHGWY